MFTPPWTTPYPRLGPQAQYIYIYIYIDKEFLGPIPLQHLKIIEKKEDNSLKTKTKKSTCINPK